MSTRDVPLFSEHTVEFFQDKKCLSFMHLISDYMTVDV